MEIAKDNSTTTLIEVDIGNSTDSLQRYLDLQKELFHSQIDQLQKIVVTQCKLTGANPLSQEMAAGALSINIGKRPRDLLNPKAVKYMQSVFSIKDTISKKESREISALFGVTITQVREFFASQRSRVRKHVRLAREKAIKSDKCKTSQDECSTSSDPATSIIEQAPLNTLEPKPVEEAPSSSSQGETIPGIDASDKNFLDNIFNLMRKEEAFSGQVKLMEWIMRIQNPSVLYWFLTKGGLMILAAWLSNAAIEEQTTVLLVILKVLCHLPLHKALPVQMSAILQTVNRLRFYRASDISNRAKVLLTRWSKLFVRSQALKKPSFTDFPNEIHKEIIQKQRTSEMINSELQSKVDLPEDILGFTYESSENCRKSESPLALKLLPASADDSNKKHSRSVTSTQTRERRKVLLVEQPGRNSTGRSLQVARPVSSNQGRPMSTDDIQKAKMRAVFMQSKYGKSGASSNENHQQKTEVPNRPPASQTSHLLLASRTPVRPKIEEKAKPVVLASENSSLPEAPVRSKLSSGSQDPSWEKLKRDQIPWQMPPDIRINSLWRVGIGEKSKEVEIQRDRMRREKEIVYQRIQDIPPNPKEPWDWEMDYDDTLTPEIPTEQPPEADGAENLPSPHNKETVAEASTSTPVPASIGNVPETEPDLELLAVLLKNPELVFALTSGHGGNITSEETVKLLDMIKTNGIGLPIGNSNRLAGGNTGGNVEDTTLPSPTPPSEIRMNRWRSEVAKDPIPQPFAVAATPTIPMLEKLPTTGLIRPQTPTTNFSMLQSPSKQQQQRHPVINSEYFPAGSNPSSSLPITQIRTNPSSNQISSLQQNMLAAGLPLLQPEAVNFGQMHNVKPASVSIVLNHPHKDRIAVTLPPLLPTPLGSQPPILPEPSMIQPQPQISWQWNEPSSNSGSGRQTGFEGSVSNPPRLQVDQNNYNVYAGGSMRPPFPQYPSWERNEYVSEQELENWSPDRSPDRSPGYRSGRNISEPRRDTGGRNSRNDWSRRRDSGRRDSSRNGGGGGGNRRWRDRRN